MDSKRIKRAMIFMIVVFVAAFGVLAATNWDMVK